MWQWGAFSNKTVLDDLIVVLVESKKGLIFIKVNCLKRIPL